MARVSSKHDRDQALDFQGFLSDLQDWELSLKEKDKKLKAQAQEDTKTGLPPQRGKGKNASQHSSDHRFDERQGQVREHENGSSPMIRMPDEDKRPAGKTVPIGSSRNYAGQFDYTRNFDAVHHVSRSFLTEENSPDAVSEKDLGNEYFKQKKFKEAIDCYSRSIALSPTSVAFANRAMAYIKIKRFEDAENDCTEALNLDDRYIKAYSRRATARKELGKLKESIEDSEFALRLEPHNQEIKKQYAEAKALYQKEILGRASGAVRSITQGAQKSGNSLVEVKGDAPGVPSFSTTSQMTGPVTVQRNHNIHKQELNASVQELALRAASRAMAEVVKDITPPKSAYQFEVSWRGFSGDRALQARYLKVIPPETLPHLFKSALSAPLLIDIVKCIATFFMEDMELAVKFLENLTRVSRFDMIIMCLPSVDMAELFKIWDEVFCSEAIPFEYAEIIGKLHAKYFPKGSQVHT